MTDRTIHHLTSTINENQQVQSSILVLFFGSNIIYEFPYKIVGFWCCTLFIFISSRICVCTSFDNFRVCSLNFHVSSDWEKPFHLCARLFIIHFYHVSVMWLSLFVIFSSFDLTQKIQRGFVTHKNFFKYPVWIIFYYD